MNASAIFDRRRVLAGGGALIISFSLASAFAQDQSAPAAAPAASLPGSLKKSPFLDSWIRIDADGSITVFTGKAELGQGFKTAFQQIAAEELDVRFESLKVITADTHLTANEEYTAGSHSVQDSAPRFRTRPRRRVNFCSRKPRGVSVCLLKICALKTVR